MDDWLTVILKMLKGWPLRWSALLGLVAGGAFGWFAPPAILLTGLLAAIAVLSMITRNQVRILRAARKPE